MGHKIVLFLLLFCSSALGDNWVGSEFFTSEDTDGNFIRQIGGQLWKDDYGLEARNLFYSNPETEYSGESLSLLFSGKVEGTLGIAKLGNTKYLRSDLWTLYRLKKNIYLNAGFYSDIVDSPRGLENGITTYGYYAGGEWFSRYLGVSATIRRAHFSDGIEKRREQYRIYVPLKYGFSLYRNWDNKTFNEKSPDYFSPGFFSRDDWGISLRSRTEHFLIRAHYDRGTTKLREVPFEKVKSWRIGVETHERLFGCSIGSDLSNLNYKYDYFSCSAYLKLP